MGRAPFEESAGSHPANVSEPHRSAERSNDAAATAEPRAESGGAQQHKIVLYESDMCGYCWRAKRLLASKGYTFDVVDVTNDSAARRWLAKETGRRTVPQIKIGERWVGGFDDIYALDKKGELDRIVRNRG